MIVSAIKSSLGASFVLIDLATEANRFFTTVLSYALVCQYEDVIHRPEHRVKGWTDRDLYALVQSLLAPSEFAPTNFTYRPLLADAGDELVLEAAINGQANYIVTFNVKDFRPAIRFGIKVITPGRFLHTLKERGFTYGEE